MANFIDIATSNFLLNMVLVSCLLVQVLKIPFEYFRDNRINLRKVLDAGGMPSSHSSVVSTLAIGTARIYGFSSPYFTIAFVLAIIVMYDAMNVRRETGEHAKVLNRLGLILKSEMSNEKKFKEILGHTPVEVIVGSLLGILIGLVMPVE